VSGRKRKATRDINGNDSNETAGDEKATGEGSVAEVPDSPREVGMDTVELLSQTGDEPPFYGYFLCVY